MKTVTRVRTVGRDRVAVELDGEPWRTMPLEALVHAGIAEGVVLDRSRVRLLARELRRLNALRSALGILRSRDHTRAELEAKLDRRRMSPVERDAALSALERAGIVDDRRFAEARAASLCARGAGDLLIRDDLERRGVRAEIVEETLATLDEELERGRVVVEAHGGSFSALRKLARKGFTPETLAELAGEARGAFAEYEG